MVLEGHDFPLLLCVNNITNDTQKYENIDKKKVTFALF